MNDEFIIQIRTEKMNGGGIAYVRYGWNSPSWCLNVPQKMVGTVLEWLWENRATVGR